MTARILVVEDDRFIREVVAIALRADGFAVDVVEDGDRACHYLAERSPALVVLDLALPFIDGFAICRRMRAVPRLARVPVLATSAAPGERTAAAALEAGADAFLHKPFDLGDLIDCVRRLLTVERRDGPPDGLAQGLVPPPSAADSSAWRVAIEGQTARGPLD